ncbi:MAG: polysaccharide biosynthesis C-terminal domain-containing protein [Ruminococcus sp.]|jgi:O-antigen/teichoic acid export membrane protein|nr:polysaccharide biosynthesis C-terminal domain-containing protein [Ruminococcus sp.]
MNKYKKLVSDTAVFAIGSFGAKFLSFFLVRLYTGVMNEAEYGQADLIYQTINVLYPLITLAMADAVIRFGLDKGYSKTKVYSSALFVTLVGCGVFALASPALNTIPEFFGYTFYIYAACMFSCGRQITAHFIRARNQVKLFALDGILATLTTVIGNVIFLLALGMGVRGYVLSIICSDILSILFLSIVGGSYRYINFRGIASTLLHMVKYSLPLVPTYILWWITSASDRWFVIALVGETENGIYSAGYKIPTLLLMFTTLFFQAWQMSVIENKDDKDITDYYSKVWRIYSALLLVGACGLILICKPLTYILVDTNGKDFVLSYRYSAILIFAMVFQCSCQFLTSIYNVKKRSLNACVTALVAAGVNIALNAVLIPRIGVLGAALATAAAYLLCFVVRIIDARRYIKFSPYVLKLTLNTVLAAAAAAVCYLQTENNIVIILAITLVAIAFNLRAVIDTVKKILRPEKITR